MPHLVFSQAATLEPDEFRLVAQGRAHFGADVSVTRRQFSGQGADARASLSITVSFAKPPCSASLSITIRPTTDHDLDLAAQAEMRGRAGGMAALARRCPSVWEVEAADDTTPGALWMTLALFASVLLGPVMPPDHTMLVGVRGARERASQHH